MIEPATEGRGTERLAGHPAALLGGVAVFLLLRMLPAPEGLTAEGWATAAVAAMMAVWWLTEAAPVAVTALLPLVLLPLLGVIDVRAAAAPYANPLIFLFLGGFLLALGMERWNLHRRIALHILVLAGDRRDRIVAGFMIATALLSMWVSNTATAVIMLPIAVSVVGLVVHEGDRQQDFPVALLLAVAYGASTGGLATLIGTPPNALLAGFLLESYDIEIGFGEWMLVGLPTSVLMLGAAWLVLTRLAYRVDDRPVPGLAATLDGELARLGPLSRGEWTAGTVFAGAALLWVTQPLVSRWVPGLTDAGIAVGAAVLLFVVPVDLRHRVFALDWATTRRLPWQVLILFGGGLSLAGAIADSGLAGWIGDSLSATAAVHFAILTVIVVGVIVFLTELTSNTATTAAFLPVLAAIAVSLGESPMLLAAPAALAASCAFMMPVGTPPNAIVFASGRVSIPEMAYAGIWLNLLGILVIAAIAWWLLPVVLL